MVQDDRLAGLDGVGMRFDDERSLPAASCWDAFTDAWGAREGGLGWTRLPRL